MKFWLIICFTCFCALVANAAGTARSKQPPLRISGNHAVLLKTKKAFFAPVKNGQNGQQSETFHRDNCSHSVTQCRTNGNENIISGHSLPLALVLCSRSQHSCPVLPAYTSTLSRLLLFPNHYFW